MRSLDAFRVACALAVFAFHVRIHLGADFGALNFLVGRGHLFMVAFFMLSGFCLFHVDRVRGRFAREADGPGDVARFLGRRLVALYPLYLCVCLLYLLEGIAAPFVAWLPDAAAVGLADNLVAAPMELAMLQSLFAGSFSFLHNDGTWFVSCVFVCYLFYPYVSRIVDRNARSANLLLALALYCVSSYAFLPVHRFGFAEIYANPLLRMAEFALGVVAGKFFADDAGKPVPKGFRPLLAGSCLALPCGIALFSFLAPSLRRHVEAFDFIAIPCFGAVLYLGARIESGGAEMRFGKAVSVLAENAYAFFLAQFFSWLPVDFLASRGLLENRGGFAAVAVAAAWTCVLAAALHYGVEKRVRRLVVRS